MFTPQENFQKTSHEAQAPRLFYPFLQPSLADGYPTTQDFEVTDTTDCRGAGLRAVCKFDRGQLMARVSGHIVSVRLLHTLQISAAAHLFDPYFTGLQLHSCNPHVRLDMGAFEMWALRPIQAGELLTMDYATTEDVLTRQFECQCGALSCRFWVTGAKELPNAQGQLTLTTAEYLKNTGIAPKGR